MKDNTFNLTHPQKRIWYSEKLYPNTSFAVIASSPRLKTDLNRELLEEAINIVISQNESLRLRIIELAGDVKQYVSTFQTVKIDFFDFSASNSGDDFQTWVELQTKTPFNLIDSDLFYFSIVRFDSQTGGFYLKMHHLITDAWTMELITRRIVNTYQELRKNLPLIFEKKPSYEDYALREADYRNSDKFNLDRDFWNKEFQTLPEITGLKPFNSNAVSIVAERKRYKLSRELTLDINDFCKEFKVSVFEMALAVFSIYLSRITLSEDLIIGTILHNRSGAKEKETAGMFVSTVPVRLNVDNQLDFILFLKTIAHKLKRVLRHQKYPYDLLAQDLREQGLKVDYLFDAVLSYQTANYREVYGDWHFNGYNLYPFAVHLSDRLDENQLNFEIDYQTALFSGQEIEKIYVYFISLLSDALKNPTKKIFELEMLLEEEKLELLREFNNTNKEYPKDRTIYDLFEEQVVKTPDRIAVVCETRQLTFRELNIKANQLARVLRGKDVKPGSIVGITTGFSVEMAIGLLGILKAGGAYLPINAGYPAGRVKYLLLDSKCRLLITRNYSTGNYSYDGVEIINLADWNFPEADGSNLPKVNKPGDLAYVIYTSGTTGRPKGVMVSHQSISNTIQWRKDEYTLSYGDCILQLFSFSFDGFLTSFFTPLVSGAKTVLLKEDEVKNPITIKNTIVDHHITHILCTPSLYAVILEYLSPQETQSLKIITLGGEKPSLKMIFRTKALNPNLEMTNEYGPTENSVVTTIFRNLQLSSDVLIGKPIYNTRVFVLDRYFNLLPIGTAGELYISGDGLARGYLNRPDLTGEKFLPNPFTPGERLYRTGDLVRWRTDGNLEFLRRLDDQVKIRGFRIEPGEIENLLLNYPSIKETVVIPKEDRNGNKFLCAYFTSNEVLDPIQIKNYLMTMLPEYQIPSFFVQISRMPLTSQGKINRAALPEPDQSVRREEYCPPNNIEEQRLAGIFEEILGVEKIGIFDNFFELGGNSLNATLLLAKVRKQFEAEIQLRDLFKTPTIKELGQIIRKARGSLYSSVRSVEEREYYPVSSAQKGLYILEQFQGIGVTYNMPEVLIINEKLDWKIFEEIFRQLIERHEVFRTSFAIINEELVQHVHNTVDLRIFYRESERKNLDRIIEEFIRPFDLKQAPLLRVGLVKLSGDEYALLFDMHHIISDGISIKILCEEFSKLYLGKQLPELTIRFKDFSVWESESLQSGLFKKQEVYWLKLFSKDLPVLNLPTDYPRPPTLNFEGEKISWEIGAELTRNLSKLARETETTLFMILLASFNILLSKYTTQEDIIIGSPVGGRAHQDFEKVIGMFTNILPLRNFPVSEKRFLSFLRDVKENFFEAYENQEYPFEVLIQKLDLKRDPGRNPLFDICFDMINHGKDTGLLIEGLVVRPYPLMMKTAKFDLTFYSYETGDHLWMEIEYRTSLFKPETIFLIKDHLVEILNQIIIDKNVSLKEIAISNRLLLKKHPQTDTGDFQF